MREGCDYGRDKIRSSDTKGIVYDLIEKNDCLKNKYIRSEINDFEDGSWRYERFNNYIMNNVALTTLSINKSDLRRKSQIRVTIMRRP